MKKEKLLSIGALSKRTGVHIKSLRYYDRLGILRPAYVDPDSGYRYYSLYQILVVDAIQLCVELGIPLKNFTEYYTESSHRLHYAKLIEQGAALAEEKIRAIQERLSGLKEMQAEINRSELVSRSGEAVRCRLPAMDLWLAPCPGVPEDGKDPAHFHRMMQMAESSGLKIGYYAGLLLRCQRDRRELFSYISVEIPSEKRDLPSHILRLPAGEYLCRREDTRSILDAEEIFPEQFAVDYEKIVLSADLLSGEYDYLAPYWEIRCSLPEPAV